MTILIGLTAPSSPWEQLLIQEGAPFVVIDPRDTGSVSACSVLVVTGRLDDAGRHAVTTCLRQGGAVLGFGGNLQGISGFETRHQPVRFLEPESATLPGDGGILDIDGACFIPREARDWRTDDRTPAVFAGPCGGGYAVVLPFDPPGIMADSRSTPRRFPFNAERLPSEIVSTTGKGGMRHLLRASLEYLHHVRNIPYAHLWYFPDGKGNLLALRIDTDGASPGDVDTLRKAGERQKVPLTWFLDVHSHESWIDRFRDMEGDQAGVHCYEHRLFRDLKSQRRDIARAADVMRARGITISGFAAPYGRWSEGLSGVLEEMGFPWSSEFGFLYDTLPWFPELRARRSLVLQMPIHPICVGSLRRAGYSPGRMRAYFQSVIERKLLLAEPLFFYHHPTHRHEEIVEDLLAASMRGGAFPVTLGGYASWWKARCDARPSFEVAGGVFCSRLESDGTAARGLSVRLSLPGRGEAVVPLGATVRLDDPVAFSMRAAPAASPDLRRTREFDLRSAVGDLVVLFQRRFR